MSGRLIHSFVPARENDHHPHLLRANVIRAFTALVLVAELAFLVRSLHLLPEGNLGAILAPTLVAQTNERRSENALIELTVDPLLSEAATEKAKDMAEKGYFSHIGPSGEQPWVWLHKVGYYYLSAGENLAINFVDSEDVTRAWMDSPGHRANILNGNFTEIGIGTAEGMYKGKMTTFVVQFFAAPYVDPRGTDGIADAPNAGHDASPIATVPEPTSTPTRIVLYSSDAIEASSSALVELATTSEEPVAPIVLGEETVVHRGEVTEAPTMLGMVVTDPKRLTTIVILVTGALVFVALASTVLLRKREHHGDAIANGLIFLAIIAFVLMVNTWLEGGAVTLS